MRISKYNIHKYLQDTYGAGATMQQQRHLSDFPFLLQAHYGEANDCTLTSMTAIIHYLTKGKNKTTDIYDYVEKIATKYFYKGTRGTPFITIRKIFHNCLNKYKLPKAYVKYGKDIGYQFKHIQSEINKGNPLILSMVDDGRDYYENHSITIVGYETWKVGSKTIRMLAVADNWNKSVSYVDYEKLSAVSSIHYSGVTIAQRFNMWKQLKNLK